MRSARPAVSEKLCKGAELVPATTEWSLQHLEEEKLPGLGAQLRLAGCRLLDCHQGAIRPCPVSGGFEVWGERVRIPPPA